MPPKYQPCSHMGAKEDRIEPFCASESLHMWKGPDVLMRDKTPLGCRWLRTPLTSLITRGLDDFPAELLPTNEMNNFV